MGLGVTGNLTTGLACGLEDVSGVPLLQATLPNTKVLEITIQVAVLGKGFHIIRTLWEMRGLLEYSSHICFVGRMSIINSPQRLMFLD